MTETTSGGEAAEPSGNGLRVSVPCCVEAVESARQRVVEACAGWGLGDLEDVAVVVSELVTNAIVHGGSGPELSVTRVADDAVRIEVADDSAAPPYIRNPYDQHTRGLGLHVVDALSHRWGHEPRGSGKVVWAHLVLETAGASPGDGDRASSPG